MIDVGMYDCEYLSELAPELPKDPFKINLAPYLELPSFF